MRINDLSRWLCWVCFAGLILTIGFGVTCLPLHGDDTKTAQEILRVAKVSTGLCVDLGCGGKYPGLAIALAQDSGLLVHGLTLDGASLAKARKKIDAAGLAGRIMVERLPAKELPYVPNLVSLLVVEDSKAVAKSGVTREEMLRILSPGGVLCTREEGKWTRFEKPRPPEMDEWPHPHHGPDCTRVSTESLIKPPVGLRWQDGVPYSFNGWSAVRSWVLANGRCFTVGTTELENAGIKRTDTVYLTARNAYNGLPLWKTNCEWTDVGINLSYQNVAPVAADADRVYAAKGRQAVAWDAATGQLLVTYPTKFPVVRLLLLDGVLVVSGWEEKTVYEHGMKLHGQGYVGGSVGPGLWDLWTPKVRTGDVAAFQADTGALLWSVPQPAQTIVAADGMVYALLVTTDASVQYELLGAELKTGRELWRVPQTKFGTESSLTLNCAAPGVVVLTSGAPTAKKPGVLHVLSAKDGSTLWQIPTQSEWATTTGGEVYCDSKRYNAKTGEIIGPLAFNTGSPTCQAPTIMGKTTMETFIQQHYAGVRGACIQNFVPANGMFTIAQRFCICRAGQLDGFLGIGPVAPPPTAAEYEARRPIEQGPAFGKVESTPLLPADWPTYRHDAGRSASTPCELPAELAPVWKAQLVTPGQTMLDQAWRALAVSCVSAPVCASGMVFVAKSDAGQVVALDAATGQVRWCVSLGSYLDTPPTIYNGLCLQGCHDGWLYALRASDGQLVWRLRAAPQERRLVAFGHVASVWPVIGAVLVHDNIVYATAGRSTESDGGVAFLAVAPATGETLWSKQLGHNFENGQRRNDLLMLRDNAIGWNHILFEPGTGKVVKSEPAKMGGGLIIERSSYPMLLDGAWTLLGPRRGIGGWNCYGSCHAFHLGKVEANLLAWNETLIAGDFFLLPRTKTEVATLKPEDYTWKVPSTGQVHALVLTPKAVLALTQGIDKTGKSRSSLLVQAADNGKTLAELPLESPPTYDGMAVANNRVFVTLQDGSLHCFGAKAQ